MKARYCGRFAPTPSGPLHLGSLLAALASWMEARSNSGLWRLRIDDLDKPRCPAGTTEIILDQLRAHALAWDGEVYYQSQHTGDYEVALERLAETGRLFRCACTRKRLASESTQGPDGAVYSGRCRGREPPVTAKCSLRMTVPDQEICLEDFGLGRRCRDLRSQVGDFVVRRNDDQIAYQLACAVDEHNMQVSHVVRGADLLGSTFQQLAVMQALGSPAPHYHHLPLLVGADGDKLSKQTFADPLASGQESSNLRRCLRWLGQEDPGPLAEPEAILAAALATWSAAKIPRTAQIQVESPV